MLPPGSSWPAVTDLVDAGYAPPFPYPALNCQFTPLLFPIDTDGVYKTRLRAYAGVSNPPVDGTQQVRRWSSTIPVACIKA